MAYIARVQVQEGFLAGLDLRFDPGLNCIIGPRGSGKTSIIELIRFCLDAPSLTDRAGSYAIDHARSVLGSGEVTVTLQDGERLVSVSRTVADPSPRASGSFASPLVLSQNEIESIGLDAVGRLRLLDGFRSDVSSHRRGVERLRREIQALTNDSQSIRREADHVAEQIEALRKELLQLPDLEARQRSQLAQLTEADQRRKDLEALAHSSAELAVQYSVYERSLAALVSWNERVRALVASAPRLESWPPSAGGADGLASVREQMVQVSASLTSLNMRVSALSSEVSSRRDSTHSERVHLDARARTLREELEAMQAGSGNVARLLSDLREKAGQQIALHALNDELDARQREIAQAREKLLDRLDDLCAAEFASRKDAEDWLNKRLGPRIRVEVTRAGLAKSYADAIRNVLRGSGLRYNEIANAIADRISPRELALAAENGDTEFISGILGIASERASRLLAEIARGGTASIVACEVEDTVTLQLLDGGDYKTTESLSTGQRCTVILPLLLSRSTGALIIDQPEDHLDNAFIVDTAVEAMGKRSPGIQLIFSTHNPNIPVLGAADRVILMGSDGRRGFVRHAAPLDDPRSVKAITTVMEGGIAAFDRRSRFYRSNEAR